MMSDNEVKQVLAILEQNMRECNRSLNLFGAFITGLNFSWMLISWYLLYRFHQ